MLFYIMLALTPNEPKIPKEVLVNIKPTVITPENAGDVAESWEKVAALENPFAQKNVRPAANNTLDEDKGDDTNGGPGSPDLNPDSDDEKDFGPGEK